jgi:hypothetical protein
MTDIPAMLTRMCIASKFGPVMRMKCPAKERKTPAQNTASHSSPHFTTGCNAGHSNPRQFLGTWQPDTELKLVRIEDPASSHALIGDDNSSVRVLPVGDKWPLNEVRQVLKDS